MNKLIRMHIDNASPSVRRTFRITRSVVRVIGFFVMLYAVLLGLWWSVTVIFAMTPGV